MKQDLDYFGDKIDTFKPSLQLEKIRGFKSQHLDEEEMEKVTSSFFPPWGADLPYSIEIGSLNKEKEKLLHVQGIRESFGKNHIMYYTDASQSEEAVRIGVALYKFDLRTQHSHRTLQYRLEQRCLPWRARGYCKGT
ncbi:hypothetical protein K3495_g1769 [Podosphaera aphanis]|nr:hypothetical protein K3495_g1769 [Podosphaera aphanis]